MFFFNRMTETWEINEQTLTATDFNLLTFPFYLLFGFEMLFFNQGYHEEILLSLALTSIPLSWLLLKQCQMTKLILFQGRENLTPKWEKEVYKVGPTLKRHFWGPSFVKYFWRLRYCLQKWIHSSKRAFNNKIWNSRKPRHSDQVARQNYKHHHYHRHHRVTRSSEATVTGCVFVTDTTSHWALFDLHYLLHVIICGQVLHKIALHLLEASSSLHFIIVFHLVVHLATGVIGRTVNLGLVLFALIDGVRIPDSLWSTNGTLEGISFKREMH